MFRLVKHTKRFVEAEEGLCIQVLQHLRNMVERDVRFGRKVRFSTFHFLMSLLSHQGSVVRFSPTF